MKTQQRLLTTALRAFAIMLAVLLNSSLVVAGEVPVHIALAPDVQQEMRGLTPQERTQIKQAIKAGNQFAQLFFDGTAQGFDPEDTEAWSHIAPLVAVGDEEWSNRSRLKAKEFKLGESQLDGNLVVCPRVVLFSIQRQPEHLLLSYRATVMGTLSLSPKDINEFYYEGQGTSYVVGFELDAHDRITRLMAQKMCMPLCTRT